MDFMHDRLADKRAYQLLAIVDRDLTRAELAVLFISAMSRIFMHAGLPSQLHDGNAPVLPLEERASGHLIPKSQGHFLVGGLGCASYLLADFHSPNDRQRRRRRLLWAPVASDQRAPDRGTTCLAGRLAKPVQYRAAPTGGCSLPPPSQWEQ